MFFVDLSKWFFGFFRCTSYIFFASGFCLCWFADSKTLHSSSLIEWIRGRVSLFGDLFTNIYLLNALANVIARHMSNMP